MLESRVVRGYISPHTAVVHVKSCKAPSLLTINKSRSFSFVRFRSPLLPLTQDGSENTTTSGERRLAAILYN